MLVAAGEVQMPMTEKWMVAALNGVLMMVAEVEAEIVLAGQEVLQMKVLEKKLQPEEGGEAGQRKLALSF